MANSERFAQLRRQALILGGAGAVACLVGALFNADQFFRSYLMAYLFWLGISLGCLPLLMLHHLVGGKWGFVIRRILESGTRTLLPVAILFIPVLIGMHHLYEWSHPEVVRADEALSHKSLYLNVPFFVVRYLIYFGAWLTVAHFLNKWSVQQDRTGDVSLLRRFQLLSAGGILVYSVGMTFASVDWAMSLEPHWYSTIYGMLFITGQLLSTMAFVIAVSSVLADDNAAPGVYSRDVFHDLGNLMLAFIMLWAYMSFSQYLIIWSGNLPEEIPWYLHRSQHGWQWVAALLALFHFALPFLLLLARGNKKNRGVIRMIAIAMLVMRFVDVFWLVAPAFRPSVSLHWLDLAALLAIGGLWLSLFVTQLGKQSLLPLRDPNFQVEKAV